MYATVLSVMSSEIAALFSPLVQHNALQYILVFTSQWRTALLIIAFAIEMLSKRLRCSMRIGKIMAFYTTVEVTGILSDVIQLFTFYCPAHRRVRTNSRRTSNLAWRTNSHPKTRQTCRPRRTPWFRLVELSRRAVLQVSVFEHRQSLGFPLRPLRRQHLRRRWAK